MEREEIIKAAVENINDALVLHREIGLKHYLGKDVLTVALQCHMTMKTIEELNPGVIEQAQEMVTLFFESQKEGRA